MIFYFCAGSEKEISDAEESSSFSSIWKAFNGRIIFLEDLSIERDYYYDYA